MTFINPLATSILQSTHVQQQAAVDRSRSVRQRQTAARNVAALSDRLEHEVENVEEASPTGDEEQKERPPGKRRRPAPKAVADESDGQPHLDVKG